MQYRDGVSCNKGPISLSRRRLIAGALSAGVVSAASLVGEVYGARVLAPVLIGLDAEFGDETSTSAEAVRVGAQMAIDDVNASGGVLSGRPLSLWITDNRSVPARGVKNVEQFASMTDCVGFLCGKFSPVTMDLLPVVHRERLILLNPWSAADAIIDNGYQPNYAFRVGLRDSWAMATLIDAAYRRGFHRLGFVFPTSGWGRSCQAASEKYMFHAKNSKLFATEWHYWGERSSISPVYAKLLNAGVDAVILVANEPEGSKFVRSIASRSSVERLPVFSHWGITGGDFPALCGSALHDVDLSVVQTFSFARQTHPEAQALIARALEAFKVDDALKIPSVVGFAHAYDLVRMIALAVDIAGTTERAAVRDALLRIENYPGVVKFYSPPFSPERHEALEPSELFLARFDAESRLVPV